MYVFVVNIKKYCAREYCQAFREMTRFGEIEGKYEEGKCLV